VIEASPISQPFLARRTLDARGMWVLPGAVDAHVHCFSEPGEGFVAATRAAAAGGVTTIIEMPYDAVAPVTSRDVLERKIERLRGDAVVDVALLGTIRKTGGVDEIPGLVEAGVAGFKVSLFETDPQRFPRIADDELLDAFRLIQQAGRTVGVHAEDGEIINAMVARYRSAGMTYARAHCETRPPVSETASVALALELAAQSGVRLHIYHASLPRTFELVSAARSRNGAVSAETCPHYLLLRESDMDRLGGFGKINPPLRSESAVTGLWDLLANDSIDLVASDHAPWPRSKKQHADIFANASGAPGVETLVPLLFSEGVATGRLSISQLARLVAEAPARRFDLWPRKGQIAVGADADITIIDPRHDWKVEARLMHSSADWSPYEGRTISGRVVTTIVRGQFVYDDGKVVGVPGEGHFVRPI
jgi:allantoinase